MASNLLLRIDGAKFRDGQQRQVLLHGINVAGDAKLPAYPPGPSHEPQGFFDGDTVSFVDRPFPLAEAPIHLARLRRWGYNTIRYIFTWEALEHAGPGQYDEDFIRHTLAVLRVARRYGFYVFMDPHQDVWSRFTGGSGAPLWTIYACGLDPRQFRATEAAVVQNTWPDPATFPRMTWATNYWRLACQTIFTFFYAGRDFAPRCVIDGRNIQDYLQDHFVAACRHLAHRIHEAGDLHGAVVIGYESLNEPNRGFIGHPDLAIFAPDQNLKKHTCPTPFQAMLTGSGHACEVDVYDFGSFGPYKSGSQLIDPQGASVWLDPATWDDTHYGWKRADSWKLGEDVWAQHGVWDVAAGELTRPDYFAAHPRTGEPMDQEYYTNHHFLDLWRKYRDAIRSVWPDAIMLMQPSPFEIPPCIRDTPDDDPNMVFASHFYDGITLITKKWNRWWNVDVLGLLRGRYSSPAFAVKIGETAIRNCFRNQLDSVRREGEDYMGMHPCLYTEIGIPYDMDEKAAYRTGDYTSQAAAVDANYYAVEGSGAAGLTWWVYTASNSHEWGDQWNGEDLSVYCAEDRLLPPSTYSDPEAEDDGNSTPAPSLSFDPENPNYSASRAYSNGSNSPVTPASIKKTFSVEDMTPASPPPAAAAAAAEGAGFRAAEAFVRPYPALTHGTLSAYGFDWKKCVFTIALTAPSATPMEHPTVIFLPGFHFPRGHTDVRVSGGKWEIRVVEIGEGDDGEGEVVRQQVLNWWHGAGEQSMTVTGVRRKGGTLAVVGEGEEEGYLEAYRQMGRNCCLM